MFHRIILFIGVIGLLGFANIALAEQVNEVSGSNTNERLSNAAEQQNIVLDDTAKTKVVDNCVSAQQKLGAVKQQSDKAIISRLEIYGGIQKDMQTIKLRMIRQGSDASETDLLTGKLQQLLDELTIQADKHGTILNDLTNLKCQEKPEQFKAGLILARAQRAELLDISSRLKKTFDRAEINIYDQLKKRLEL